jgi:hypothetical protein
MTLMQLADNWPETSKTERVLPIELHNNVQCPSNGTLLHPSLKRLKSDVTTRCACP